MMVVLIAKIFVVFFLLAINNNASGVVAKEYLKSTFHNSRTNRQQQQRRRVQGASTTCGGGVVGSGICSDTTLCCSTYGYCGNTSDYCGNRAKTAAPVSAPAGTCGGGSIGNAICTESTLCCSAYGYCGNTSDYCNNKATAMPVRPTAAPVAAPIIAGTCGGGNVGNAICVDSTLCCSAFGYCGNTSDYCNNKAKTVAPAPTPPGTCGGGNVGNAICVDPNLCCSAYGYCGSTNDYCGNKAKTPAPLAPIAPFAPVTSYPTPSPVPVIPISCGGLPNVMAVNFGYYASWASGRACNPVKPQDINVTGNHYTHLAYAFAGINASDGIAPSGDDYAGEVPKYAAFNALKQTYPDLKTLIAVGGGTFNGKVFSDIAASGTRRATFATSVISFLQTYGFDGIDVDWEFPGDSNGKPSDYQTFPLLIKAIRDASTAAGKKILITMAITINMSVLHANYDLTALSPLLDFYNVMAYDISGPWNDPKVVGSSTDLPYIRPTIAYMLEIGVPSNKMVLGLAAYGHTFYLTDPNCNTPGCKFTFGGPGGCAGDTGFMPYFTIDQFVQSNNYNALRFNPTTSSMEMVTNGNVWISFDNPFTYDIKASYAASNCMRGVMWWSVDQLISPIVLRSSTATIPNPTQKPALPPSPVVSPTKAPQTTPTRRTTSPPQARRPGKRDRDSSPVMASPVPPATVPPASSKKSNCKGKRL